MNGDSKPTPDAPKSAEYLDPIFIKMLGESVQSAISRSRWVLLITILASTTLITFLWNGTFSWNRRFQEPKLATCEDSLRTCLEKQRSEKPVEFSFFRVVEHKDSLEENRVMMDRANTLWLESTYVTLPVVGLKISICDIAIFGSGGIFLLTIWLFFAARRENHALGRVLSMYQDRIFELRYLYYAITMKNVFTTVTENDDILSDLNMPSGEKDKFFGVRAVYKLLYYIPFLSILMIVVTDYISIFQFSPVSKSNFPLIVELARNNNYFRIIQALVFDAIALTMAISCYLLGHSIKSYELGNIEMLKTAREIIHKNQDNGYYEKPNRPPDKK